MREAGFDCDFCKIGDIAVFSLEMLRLYIADLLRLVEVT